MKKTHLILITLFLVSAMLIMGCEKEEEKSGAPYEQKTTNQENCELYDGTWVDFANECEYISEDNCLGLGGTFNECGSACRNDLNAEICTRQCVPFCSFN